MLAEFSHVKQENGDGRRRWFEDDAMELIVWYRADGLLDGWQICYPGPDRQERALTWRAGRGFTHARVDAGDTRPDKNLTPVLAPDGAVPWERIETEFATRAAQLETPVRESVLAALRARIR